MTESSENTTVEESSGRSGCRLFLIVFFAMLAALVVAAIAVKWWLFPDQFKPVELSQREKQELNQKLEALGYQDQAFVIDSPQAALEPQPYREDASRRQIQFSEREINGLLAKNTELAHKLAIDFSDDLASARLVLPLDPDLPFLGGQTLRASAGLEARFVSGRPVMILKGVSVWGVPLPGAWLGHLKNVDLIAQFGHQDGFWSSFADGVEDLQVREGELYVKLKP